MQIQSLCVLSLRSLRQPSAPLHRSLLDVQTGSDIVLQSGIRHELVRSDIHCLDPVLSAQGNPLDRGCICMYHHTDNACLRQSYCIATVNPSPVQQGQPTEIRFGPLPFFSNRSDFLNCPRLRFLPVCASLSSLPPASAASSSATGGKAVSLGLSWLMRYLSSA